MPPITGQDILPSNASESAVLLNQDPAYLEILETNNYEYITIKNNETSNSRPSNLYSSLEEPSCSQNVGNYEVPIHLKCDPEISLHQDDDENHYEIITEFKSVEIPLPQRKS
jgi:hypothetical protein